MQEVRLFCACANDFDAERLTTETNEFIQSVRDAGFHIQRAFIKQEIEGGSGLCALVTLHVTRAKSKQAEEDAA